MGSHSGAKKAHKTLKENLGEEEYLIELRRRGSKGGSKTSDAKKEAARLREQRKREARANSEAL